MVLMKIPKGMELEKGTREYRRVRALSIMLQTITLAALASWFFTVLINFNSEKDLTLNIFLTFGCFLMFGLQTIAFYRFRNVRLSATFLNLSYFFLIVAFVLISGGYHSKLEVMLLSCPVIAFRIGGREEGFANTLFVAMVLVLLGVAESLEFQFEPLLNMAGGVIPELMPWGLTLVVIASSMAAYDWDE
jgi:hypothetical protein